SGGGAAPIDEAAEDPKGSPALERAEAGPESRATPRLSGPAGKKNTKAGDIKTLSLSESGANEERQAPPPVEQKDRALSQPGAVKTTPSALALEQSATKLSGRVTDRNGNPLPGATILIAGTNLGAATDKSGRYTFALPLDSLLDRRVTLECRFIGYETRSESIALQGGELTQDFLLAESSLAMDAVVVTSAADEAPKTPMRFSRAKALTRSASVRDTSGASTGVVLLSTARSGLRESGLQMIFESRERTYRVRLIPSPAQAATDKKTGLPLSFPVTIVKKARLALEMDWHVPTHFTESWLEGALFQTSKERVLRVRLKQGPVYRIDLTNDSTKATLEK
ncbi:carboxypeptidase-like regulatory domain-containing protein, partial [bacterium]|nr:carboxypeptidase-like regulatory domain-containing protein [bacterium]